MKDAAFAEQKARIKRLTRKWQRWLLPGWTVTTNYCDDRAAMPEGGQKEALAAVVGRFEYLRATVSWYMPEVEDTTDDFLEEALVHEMGHAMVNEMRLKGAEHEERVVTELTRTLFWVRDNAAKLKGATMKNGKHMPKGKHMMKGMPPKGHMPKGKPAKRGKRRK